MMRQANRDIRDLAILSSVICLFAVCLFFVSERQPNAERDFVYFYSVGRIANEHPPEQIYNLDLQRKTFEHVFPLAGNRVYGPSPYPPIVPLFFRAFSLLPFETAFHIWQLCTLALFCAGLGLLARALYPGQWVTHLLILTAGFSFCPFVRDTLLAGQLSAVGCFAFAVALFQDYRRRPFLSGVALSLAMYKPTLLLLIIPMLLVRKQWRTLGGLFTGGAALFSVVTALMGFAVWIAWIDMLRVLSGLQGFLEFPRYVDVFAFATLVAGNHTLWKNAIITSSFALGMSLLLRRWIRSKDTQIIWTATLTSTLFLNLYVPIYDAALLVPATVASAPALIARGQKSFTAVAMLIFGCSWCTELVARSTGVQVLTIVLLLLASLQLRAPKNRELVRDHRDRQRWLVEPCVKLTPIVSCNGRPDQAEGSPYQSNKPDLHKGMLRAN